MREHMGLYRGKRTDNGEWSDGSLWVSDYGVLIHERHDLAQWRYVDPETVGECTGLRDMNGKLIFEGDIVRFNYTGVNRGVEGVAIVVFENGKFCVEWGWHKELVCLDGFANTTMEIIGNAHDNPELLKGGEADGN